MKSNSCSPLGRKLEAAREPVGVQKTADGVTFSDGSAFDAYDVVYNDLPYPPGVPDSAFCHDLHKVHPGRKKSSILLPLIFHTGRSFPLVPTEVATWGIISAPKPTALTAKSIDSAPKVAAILPNPEDTSLQ